MEKKATWTFFSNHTHVLICLAQDSDQSLREVSIKVGITERAVQRIVADLEAEEYLSREKKGRQNVYKLHLDHPLRHALEDHRTIGDVVNVLLENKESVTVSEV